MAPAQDPQAVPSPCVQVCRLDAVNVCVGCGRSLDEIVEWPQARRARQLQIRELAAVRLQQRAGAHG